MAIDQKENTAPREVFLFSGHMVDAPDRSPPRFPPDKEPLAAAAIGKLLDELGAGATDVAISSGACGGDLLFAESCLRRRLRVEIYLPFVEEEFAGLSCVFSRHGSVCRLLQPFTSNQYNEHGCQEQLRNPIG